MKHVFIETNFIVDLLRPFPNAEAEFLLQSHNDRRLQLHVPWSSVAEAKRTLDRIIVEDLGFTDKMMKFTVSQFLECRQAGNPTPFDKREIDKLKQMAEMAKTEAFRTKNARVDDFAAQVHIIEPSKSVIATTLKLFDTKSLKPFDEMMIGAVLAHAEDLQKLGETDLHFCTLDKDDLGPKNRPKLASAYAACGLVFHGDFKV